MEFFLIKRPIYFFLIYLSFFHCFPYRFILNDTYIFNSKYLFLSICSNFQFSSPIQWFKKFQFSSYLFWLLSVFLHCKKCYTSYENLKVVKVESGLLQKFIFSNKMLAFSVLFYCYVVYLFFPSFVSLLPR